MDLLKRELQKKRKAAREDFAGKSFVRRSDLEQKRLQKRRDEQPKAGALESAAAAASDPSSDPYAAAGNLNNPTSCSDDSEPSLPRHEVIRRLRVLREPVTLFGEDDAARVDRLKIALKSSVIDDIDDLDMARSGQTNDFLGDMIEMGKRQKFESVGGDGNGSRSEIVEADADKDSKKRMDPAKFDELCKEDKILVFGPLYELCRKKILPDDIRQALLDIVECCMRHDYQLATEQYIKLAIGNVPWPIGVTVVGIHERSAREKICTSSVAHIMNDETTRRYLTVNQEAYDPLRAALSRTTLKLVDMSSHAKWK